MMKTLKVNVNDFGITSKYKCTIDPNTMLFIPAKGYPTTGRSTISIPYSLPSGATIKSCVFWAALGSPITGISFCTANGNRFSQKSGILSGVPITLSSTSGKIDIQFAFKAIGTVVFDAVEHTSYLSFSNCYLQIYYDAPESVPAEPKERKSGFAVPPQTVCVIDQTSNAIYTFDGVTKVQHVLTTELSEEVEGGKKDQYVNNAKNAPDKLSIDIVMSDVYSVGGTNLDLNGFMTSAQTSALSIAKNAITSNETTRSGVYFYALHWLKEQRRKLTVITPQYVHVDMIISNITVNHEDTTPFGWEGQIVFQHAFPEKKKTTTTATPKSTGSEEKMPESMVGGGWNPISALVGLFTGGN